MSQWTIISLSGCCQAESGGAAYHALQRKFLQSNIRVIVGTPFSLEKRKNSAISNVLGVKDNILRYPFKALRAFALPITTVKCKPSWALSLTDFTGISVITTFPKCNLLVSNLTRLTLKFMGGHSRPNNRSNLYFDPLRDCSLLQLSASKCICKIKQD